MWRSCLRPSIVTRVKFNAVKAELARRNAGRAPSKKAAPMGRSCYSSKYALTERLICGECGTLYRRCVWKNRRGEKFAVWRCISRIDYNTRYCHDSPTIHEKPLQAAILAAINSLMSQKEVLVERIEAAMKDELIPFPGSSVSVADIDRRIEELNKEFQELFAASKDDGGFMKYADDFKRITDDIALLRTNKARLQEQQNSDFATIRRIQNAADIFSTASAEIAEWDESIIRQLIDSVKVLSADRIRIYFYGGIEVEQELMK